MAKSSKRERQYEHVKQSEKQRGGRSARRAEEIAARTVNKQKAQSGETRGASASAGRSGGQRARSGGAERTKEQLYDEAKRRDVKGRSSMSKAELKDALGR
ncbi:plasmid stabilization protein [Streptomyces chumphonensis]|uniref:plasmid stabilization protein n=1 Tax=Streptomyces chumphonensis TaxID=1214925 RepID=UPI003D730122